MDTKFKKGNLPWNKGIKTGKPSWNKGLHWSEEHRRKLSEAHKGLPAWNKGISPSEESRRKMSITHKAFPSKYQFKKGNIPWIKGKHQSEEWKRNIGLGNLGKRRTKEAKRKMGEAWLKTFLSNPKVRERMSESHKGKHPSEETKLKLKKHRATQIFPVKDSKPEIKIQNFLKQLEISFLAHKYIKEIEHSYQCDILIPSVNLIIEVDGDYWHGNKNNNRYNNLNEYQKNKIILDKLRTKELIEKGFKVLRLWESDIKKMNLEDFKNKIEEVLRKKKTDLNN